MMMSHYTMEETRLKFVKLDPRELEYMATLEWEELMIYLEKKYGIEFRDEFLSKLQNKIENQFKETDKKWRN